MGAFLLNSSHCHDTHVWRISPIQWWLIALCMHLLGCIPRPHYKQSIDEMARSIDRRRTAAVRSWISSIGVGTLHTYRFCSLNAIRVWRWWPTRSRATKGLVPRLIEWKSRGADGVGDARSENMTRATWRRNGRSNVRGNSLGRGQASARWCSYVEALLTGVCNRVWKIVIYVFWV